VIPPFEDKLADFIEGIPVSPVMMTAASNFRRLPKIPAVERKI